ncbi:TRAP transporter small permease [Enemella sp. A6]|uniref:TRAP transporter small permease n=1 Tax=Enemella sp. A6 TaxID=3440152 RepID=UPI003EBAF036
MSNEHDHAASSGASEVPDDAVPSPAHDLVAATAPDRPEAWLPLRGLEYLGGFVVLGMALLITASVVMRAMGYGLTGVIELSSVAMLFLVLLGAPALANRDEHVRLELIDMVAKDNHLRLLSIFGALVQLVVIGFLLYATWMLFQTDLARGTTVAGELRMPRFYVTAGAMVGFLALAIGVVVRMLHELRRSRKEA